MSTFTYQIEIEADDHKEQDSDFPVDTYAREVFCDMISDAITFCHQAITDYYVNHPHIVDESSKTEADKLFIQYEKDKIKSYKQIRESLKRLEK